MAKAKDENQSEMYLNTSPDSSGDYNMDDESGVPSRELAPRSRNYSSEEMAQLANQRIWSDEDEEDDDGFNFPRLRLLSGLSEVVQEGKGRPGNIWLDGEGEIDFPFTVYPMHKTMSRARRILKDPEDPDSDQILACYSANGRFGFGDPGPGGECSSCPFLRNGCDPTQSLLCYDPDLDIIFRWDFRGTALGRSGYAFINQTRKQPKWGNGHYRTFGITIRGTKSVPRRQGGGSYFRYELEPAKLPEGLVFPEMASFGASSEEETSVQYDPIPRE